MKRKKKLEEIKPTYRTPKPDQYFRWNFFKRGVFDIYAGVNDKLHNFKIPKGFLIGLGVLTASIAGLIVFIQINRVVVEEREGFDLNTFTHAEEASEDLVELGDGRFTMYFDETSTQFALHDTDTNHYWQSSISEEDDWPGLSESAKKSQKNTLVAQYVDDSNVERSIENNVDSIERDQYYFRYPDEESVEVFYEIGNTDVDYTDLPQRISKERFENLILDNIDQEETPVDYRFIENSYRFVSEQDVYSLHNASSFSQNAIDRLHNIIFNMTPYTREDLEQDHIEQAVELPETKPMIKIGVRYTVTDEGFDATLINDSIIEKEDYPLSSVDLLPNFGEASLENEGYLFVPEGSGALIELNNEKSTREYDRRLYGEDDAKVPMSEPNPGEPSAMPLFGMKKDDNAFLAIVSEGASMASVHARVSERQDSYNRVYSRFYYKEQDRIRIPGVTSGEQSQLFRTVWTRYYSESDYQVSYRFTSQNKADYVGMSDIYRSYLESEGLTQKTDTSSLNMNVTLLGGYEHQDYLLGVPYDTVKPLTSTEQATEILQTLLDQEVNDINVVYRGWMNQGIEPTAANRITFHRAIGKERAFEDLMRFAEGHGVSIYPEVRFTRPYTTKNLNESSDTARTISGDLAIHYKYNQATKLPDESSRAEYVLNPSVLPDLIGDFNDEFQTLPFDNIAVEDLSNRLSGSYNNQEFHFRYDSEALQREALKTLQTNNQNVLLRNPLGFALPYGDLILDLPVRGTEYTIIDESIPFYQLSLSGLIDYSGSAFNTHDERPLDWHKLKALETGSHLNFTWTYEETYDLMHTDYNYLYSTHYENWIEEATAIYKELKPLGVHGSRLINHEILDRNVVKVQYDNGKDVLINYGNRPYDHEGSIVDSMDYHVEEGRES